MKILYLTGMIPAKFSNGTEIATGMILTALRELGHDVTIAGYLRHNDIEPTHFKHMIIDRRPIEAAKAGWTYKLRWAADAILCRTPLSVSKFRSARGERILKAELKNNYDLIIADKPQMAWLYRKALTGKKIGVIWHAIEHRTYNGIALNKKGAARLLYQREASLSEKLERSVAAWVDQIFVLTEADASEIRALGYKGDLHVLPLAVPENTKDPHNQPKSYKYDVGLLGSWTWSANADGLEWFLRKVAPFLKSDHSIAVAGLGSEGIVPELTSVRRLGFVPNARDFLAECRVVAIPLLTGTGISMKVLEAGCEGWPVVTTSVGARGIEPLPVNVQIADDPKSFAVALQQLSMTSLEDRHVWACEGMRWMAQRQLAMNCVLSGAIPQK